MTAALGPFQSGPFGLAAGAGALRGRMGPRLLRGINIVSGLTIFGFALWQTVQIL